MLLGLTVTQGMLIAGGSFLFVASLLQILIGMRKIHFKGKLHMKIHKALAWLMLAGALFHGIAAFAYLGVIGT